MKGEGGLGFAPLFFMTPFIFKYLLKFIALLQEID